MRKSVRREMRITGGLGTRSSGRLAGDVSTTAIPRQAIVARHSRRDGDLLLTVLND